MIFNVIISKNKIWFGFLRYLDKDLGNQNLKHYINLASIIEHCQLRRTQNVKMMSQRLVQILCVAALVHNGSPFKFVTDLISMETSVMVRCLLEDQFYHPESRS